MIMGRIIFFLWPLFFDGFLYAVPTAIMSTYVEYDVKQNPSVIKSVNNYLSRFLGEIADEENRIVAENFLKTMYFISSIHCDYKDDASRKKQLYCSIKSKRIIRDIKIVNLPASLLEGELKLKLPLQIGFAVDYDSSLKETLAVAKTRVETFLKKNGYYGASAEVLEVGHADSLLIDIVITIKNGVFARVNEVSVFGDTPIRRRAVVNAYRRMCFSFNRIIETFSTGTLGCYSRELERETTQSLQDKFAKMGYVQARIRISHHWIDVNDTSAPKSCQKRSADDSTQRCVNLRIDIDKGPKVRWSIKVKDQVAISRNAFLRFIGAIFAVDQFSRASIADESDEVALDHAIINEELLEEITFISSKNVDEQEISQSANAIKEFLVSRGYVQAEVIPSFIQEDPKNLVVNFDVFAGSPYFITAVSIKPEKYLAFIGADNLATILRSRSIIDNGHLSYQEVVDAKDALIERLKTHGFTNIKISVDMESISTGEVEVVFYVRSDERKIVDEIVISNGYSTIDETVLPLLSNCDTYSAPHRYDRNRKLCHNSSLVLDRVEDDSLRLAEFYQTSGYLYARVKSDIVDDKNGVKLVFTVYDNRYGLTSLSPLKKQDIKDVIISGNVSTKESVIKRLFPRDRKSGLLDPIALKIGLANLRESGRFSRIDERKIMAGEENSDDVYFLLHLAERPSLSFDTSISFSTDQLFMAEAELEESNFLSSMLKLNTTLGLGLFWGRQTIFNNKLVWPNIFGKPLRFTLNAPTIVYEDHSHWSKPRRRLQSKISFGLEWRLTNRITPYVKYWLVMNQEKKDPLPDASFSEQLRSLDGLIPTIKEPGKIRGVLRPGVSYTQLDNPFNPRLGLDLNWWTEFSGGPLAGSPSFINVGTQNRFFLPLGPITLALQATFMRAFIDPSQYNWDELKNGSSMINLGGDRSIRGYKEGTIGIFDLKDSAHDYAGYLSNVANFEIRFPLTAKSNIGNFSGALFVDQGMLIPCSSLFSCMPGQSLKQIIKNNGFALSIGAAVRYALPVGPLSLDYGISPLTGDGRVHLLFGYAF